MIIDYIITVDNIIYYYYIYIRNMYIFIDFPWQAQLVKRFTCQCRGHKRRGFNIASNLCFVFLALGHLGSWLPDWEQTQTSLHWKVEIYRH